MFKKGFVFLWVCLFAVVIGFWGCKGTMVGGQGGGSYELKRSMTAPNYMEASVKGDIENIHTAVLAGIADLGLIVKEDSYDKVSEIVEGTFADNDSFIIKLAHQADGTIQIRIRVGLTGNKDRSVQIFQAISGHF